MTETLKYKQLVYYNARYPFEIKEQEIEIPKDIGPDDILVKVHSAALNPVDMVLYNTSTVVNPLGKAVKGFGRDYAGEVYAVGSNIKDLAKGDRISGLFDDIYTSGGTVSEYLKINTAKSRNSNFHKIADTLNYNEAASFPLVFGTALSTLTKRHKPNKDSRVLVIGGGTSVAGYVIQLLKTEYHAKSVVSINSADSTSWVESIGADKVIDYKKEDVAASAVKIVNEDFGGEKFDLIVDTVGNNALFPVIDKILKPKSTDSIYVTVVGDYVADYQKSAFSFFSFSGTSRFIPFFRKYNYALVGIDPGFMPLAYKLFQENKLKLRIDSVYSFEDYQKAIDRTATHHARGKVVIEISK